MALAGLVARHGGGALADLATAVPHGRPAARARLLRRLGAALVDGGATFVKGAQLLSSRRDLLPERVCAALGELTDAVPAPDPVLVERTVREAYRWRPWPFARFDPTPTASGSIASVHRARLHDGREVAVKLRRRDVEQRMRADFGLLLGGARMLRHVPGLAGLPAATIVGQLADAALRQLDLRAEARALAVLRRNLGDLDYLLIPEPLEELGADGVLVMAFVPRLTRVGVLAPQAAAVAVRRVLHCAFRMLFLDGLVHCDMHAGNLYLRPDGDVVLLDAGFVVELSPRVRHEFASFFFSMARGNGPRCAQIVIDSAEGVSPRADLERFRREIATLVEDAHRRSAGEFALGPFAARLFDLQRRCGLYAAPEFVFPLLSLLVLEGMVRELDPGVDFQAEAKPVLIKALLTAVPRAERRRAAGLPSPGRFGSRPARRR